MNGIIYCLTNKIDNKPYIGLTINPKRRKREFYNINILYTSKDLEHLSKIDKARFEYGTKNFEYSILETIEAENKELLIDLLNEKEIFYIEKYDSINKGYNTLPGGTSNYHLSYLRKSNNLGGRPKIIVEYNSYSKLYEDEYEALLPKELVILATLRLSKNGVFPNREISKITGCSYNTSIKIIDQIENKGFIKRVPYKGTYKYVFKNQDIDNMDELEREIMELPKEESEELKQQFDRLKNLMQEDEKKLNNTFIID